MTRCSLILGVFVLSCVTMLAAVKTEEWGKTSAGNPVLRYTLSSDKLTIQLTNYGARIVSLYAPDREGQKVDVVLGYNDPGQYLNDPKDYFGAIVGRYGNRIAKGTFKLSNTTYHIPLNSKGNALHGGPQGFSNKIWKARIAEGNSIEFELISLDGDMGFPGTLTVRVRYTLSADRLSIDYFAETTKPTVVNLTNHTYFNLAGQGSGSVLEQKLRVDADHYTPVDSALIPTGKLESVDHSPFDFETIKPIGERIDADDPQLHFAGGYDHNFVVKGNPGTIREAAFAEDPVSGRTLTVLTTEPGVQFYSGNFLDGSAKGYTGVSYQKHAGFCLETQHFPDSPNHANFPSTTLMPGTTLHSTTVLVFGITAKRD